MARVKELHTGIFSGVQTFARPGTHYPVQTNSGDLYMFLFPNDLFNYGAYYIKSTDKGLTWETPVLISASGKICFISCWYDRWSNINADLIHIAYIEGTTTNDVLYRNLDTATDTLSTEYTIFAGASSANGAGWSLTRAISGDLICGGTIDAGAELFCYKSVDVGVNWTSIAAVGEATQDQIIMTPDPDSADNQDCFAFFWDASANEISVKRYDSSADSWAETSISGSMTDTSASTSYPHWAVTHDITNQQIILIAWTQIDTANADLKCWSIKNGSISALADVVLNSSDDQSHAALAIDTTTQYWYAFYAGKSDGSETVGTAVNVYYKVSQDAGTTWGAETQLTSTTYNVKWLTCTPRFTPPFSVAWYDDQDINEIKVSAQIIQPRSTFQLI